MNENKFGIKTRVFLTFGFVAILFVNIFFVILYNLIESSYLNNIKSNLEKIFENVCLEIEDSKKSEKNNIFNISNKTLEKLENLGIFINIGLNDEILKKNYNKGSFIYNKNLIFRGDFEIYTIILGKNISNFENFKKNARENIIIMDIFAIFIVFLMSYFIVNRVLNPLIKLSNYVGKYDISKNSKPIKNKYGNSEIGIITKSINKLIDNSKKTLGKQKKFIQDSSHELKTPLMQIATNTDILEEKINDKKCLEKIKNIKKSVENMDNIISDLAFVLREEDKILKKENLVLGEYLKNLVEEYREEANKKNIKIIVKVKKELVLENNKYYLNRLFGNLIQNSIFYNNGNSEIKIEILENKVILTDKGIGITKEELEKVFSRFYRNDKSGIYNKNGSGLGLTIVKKICDDFGWKIKIESKENLGSKFEIDF